MNMAKQVVILAAIMGIFAVVFMGRNSPFLVKTECSSDPSILRHQQYVNEVCLRGEKYANIQKRGHPAHDQFEPPWW